MRTNWRGYLLAAAVLLIVLPMWAKPKAERTDTATWQTVEAVTVGTTQIQPGDYTLRAEESGKMLEVLHDGKVVAQVSCHWIELPKRAADTEVSTTNNKVTEVEFAGRTEALQIG
jgi:hypothetical protein